MDGKGRGSSPPKKRAPCHALARRGAKRCADCDVWFPRTGLPSDDEINSIRKVESDLIRMTQPDSLLFYSFKSRGLSLARHLDTHQPDLSRPPTRA